MTARPQQVAVDALPKPAGPCLAMRAKKAAQSLDVSLSTFLTWVDQEKMPKPFKIGGVALYDFEAVRNAWEALKAAHPNDDANPWDE